LISVPNAKDLTYSVQLDLVIHVNLDWSTSIMCAASRVVLTLFLITPGALPVAPITTIFTILSKNLASAILVTILSNSKQPLYAQALVAMESQPHLNNNAMTATELIMMDAIETAKFNLVLTVFQHYPTNVCFPIKSRTLNIITLLKFKESPEENSPFRYCHFMKSSSMLTGPNTSLLTFPMILLKDKP
jgi:hypothetical protein